MLPPSPFPVDPRLAVPICAIEDRPEKLETLQKAWNSSERKQLSEEVRALLTSVTELKKQDTPEDTEDKRKARFIAGMLTEIESSVTWQSLFNRVQLFLQFRMLIDFIYWMIPFAFMIARIPESKFSFPIHYRFLMSNP